VPDYINDLAREGHLESIEKPSSARVYDYFLGGTHNYAIDREFAKGVLQGFPDIASVAKSNRAFVGRAVRYALEAGITQFIDIGSGLPSMGQAHEVADAEKPDARARVVYIDNEPIAHAHSEILLDREADPERHKAVVADFNEPEYLWEQVLGTGLIRENEPTCLIMTALLHFQPPERKPEETVAFYRDHLAPGSLLVLSHTTPSTRSGTNDALDQFQRATDNVVARTSEEIIKFFGDWDLLDPGLVWVVNWRPDENEEPWWGDDVTRSSGFAGVAAKPPTKSAP
jgi:O-methyltransferase involved in polyketide biosynthesis